MWIAGYVPQDGEQVEMQRYTQRVKIRDGQEVAGGWGEGACGILLCQKKKIVSLKEGSPKKPSNL